MRKIFFILSFFFVFQAAHTQDRKIDSLKQLIVTVKDDSTACNLFLSIGWASLFSYSDTALGYAQKALVLSKGLTDTRKESEAMLLNGYTLMVLGDYPLALEFLLKGLHIEETIKPARMTEVFYAPIPMLQLFYYVLSETYKDLGDYDNALVYLKGGMAFKRLDERDNLMEAYARLSQIYERANQLDSAVFYGEKAFDLDVQINSQSQRTPIPITLANAYRKKKNFSAALKYYHTAVNANNFSQIEKKDVIEVYNGLAETFLRLNEIDSASYYARQAMATEKVISYSLGILNTYRTLADIFKAMGDRDSIVKYLEKSVFLADSLFNQRKNHAAQNLSFNERLRQQEVAEEKRRYVASIKMYLLLGATIVFLIIAFLLYRNNVNKQRANVQLQSQKDQIERTLKDLKTTQAQLIQSEKMASLGELTAGIAHEIQNPLNFVNNFSEVNKELLSELKDEATKGNIEQVKTIADNVIGNEEKISQHGKRADAIVKSMLQHSRTSTGQKGMTDLNALCDEYLRLAYHGVRAKDKSFNAVPFAIGIKTDFDSSIGKINIVPQDIGRAILNVINNAFYTVSEKAKLQSASGGYKPQVMVQTRNLENSIDIMVEDNGNGIKSNLIDKIFQPFFTTKPAGQGTGLGLSLAYDIVKSSGGEIKVESKEGEFARFIIQLPKK